MTEIFDNFQQIKGKNGMPACAGMTGIVLTSILFRHFCEGGIPICFSKNYLE